MSERRCYDQPLPGVQLEQLTGSLIVIEGPDSSGRSSQIALLSGWLERNGFAVAGMGLKRSTLVAPALEQAQQGNVLSPRTMALFYASDFYDQLENRIVPALRAGYVVLADRYVFTLMARDLVRGGNLEWLRSLYGMALVPDAVYTLNVSTTNLAQRVLSGQGHLDYWESGMDVGLARDWYESFVRYQRRMRAAFKQLGAIFGFEEINGNRSIPAINRDLRSRVQAVLGRRHPAWRPEHEEREDQAHGNGSRPETAGDGAPERER